MCNGQRHAGAMQAPHRQSRAGVGGSLGLSPSLFAFQYMSPSKCGHFVFFNSNSDINTGAIGRLLSRLSQHPPKRYADMEVGHDVRYFHRSMNRVADRIALD
ncbi:protein of unknown function [Pararobbsia alpina]